MCILRAYAGRPLPNDTQHQMKAHLIKPQEALSKAFLKIKPHCEELDNFKKQLEGWLKHINEKESEEFNKNMVKRFCSKPTISLITQSIPEVATTGLLI